MIFFAKVYEKTTFTKVPATIFYHTVQNYCFFAFYCLFSTPSVCRLLNIR